MKNLNKLFSGLALAFGLLVVASCNSDASVVARGPKKSSSVNYTTAISSVTPFTVLEATSTLMQKPGAVYQIILATGAASDFLVLYDTIPFSTTNLTASAANGAAAGVGIPYQLGVRYFYSSTTANTVITFDPPMRFFFGLMAVNSSALDSAQIIWEPGGGITGQ